jgi:AAA+ superfamily predicted ATPase
MKHEFIKTKNYKKAKEAIEKLQNLPDEIPKMGLFYGKPGEGKSLILTKLVVEDEVTLIRTLSSWTPKEMLIDISDRLGLSTTGTKASLQRRIIAYLDFKKTVLLIDEIDSLFLQGKQETLVALRDLHDIAKTPIVFVGMENCKRRFQKDAYYYRRFSQRIEFTETTLEDTKLFCANSDVSIEDDLILYLYKKYDFGDLVVVIDMIEEYCEKNDEESINLKLFKSEKIEKSYEV